MTTALTMDRTDARDEQFLSMLRGFRASGGLHRGSRYAARARCCRMADDQNAGDVTPPLYFEWGGELWFPAFQFNPADRSLRCAPAQIIAELAPLFDGWELAQWFVAPNLWLGDARPVDLLDIDPDGVVGAARADRFIATG